jgi:hypothetical protein
MNTLITNLWDWIDNRSVIRRVVLFVTLWMTWMAFDWAANFAITTTKTGIDTAAIIAAVTAPISALQGFIFKVYSDSRAS